MSRPIRQTVEPAVRNGLSVRGASGHTLQLRDVEILKALAELRILTTSQISQLLFPTISGTTSTNCRARLRFLEHAGLIVREYQLQAPTDGRKPHIFRITSPGIQLLITELGWEGDAHRLRRRARRLSPLFLQHQLDLNDVHVRFAVTAPLVGWQIEDWRDDAELKEAHTSTVVISDDGGEVSVGVVPDGYLALRPGALEPALHFFVELDRGTMALRSRKALGHSFQRRIRAYNAYFLSQEIINAYGTRRIRVLTVTTSRERLVNMKRAAEDVGGRSRYWFTTLDRLASSDPLLDPIWYRATHTVPVALRRDTSQA